MKTSDVLSGGAIGLALLLLGASPAAALTFVELERDGAGGVDGLQAASGVAVSPDGAHVYVTGLFDSALAVFSRDPSTGALAFVEVKFDGVGGVDGLDGAQQLVVSPDGKHVYVTSFFDAALAVFARNAGTGALTFTQVLRDGVGGVDGLSANTSLAISPDGKHVYVASFDDSSVAAFSRNAATGALTFVEVKTDGVGGVDGIDGALDVEVSPDGNHVYVPGNGVGENSLATFSRDVTTGALTFVEVERDGVGGVEGLAYARNVALSPGGEHVYVTSGGGAGLATFRRNAATGALTFVDAQFGAGGLVSPLALTVNPSGTEVYVLDPVAHLLAVFDRNPTTGVLGVAEVLTDGQAGVDGLNAASAVAASPGGEHVYVTGQGDNSVAVFLPDTDLDGLANTLDNCPRRANADQTDSDAGGAGDVCDPCPDDSANLCRFPLGGGPDPSDPSRSFVVPINPATGGGFLAQTARAAGLRPHALRTTATAVGVVGAQEVVPFPGLASLTCDRQGNLYGGLSELGTGFIIKRDRKTGAWLQVGFSGFPGGVTGLATSFAGTIYASVVDPASHCGGGANALAAVNPLTGAATRVGMYGNGITQMNGLAVHPLTGTLYGVTGLGDCGPGAGPALYSISLVTGFATKVGLLRDGSGQPPRADPGDLAFDRDGTFYVSLREVGDLLRLESTAATQGVVRFTTVGATGIRASIDAFTFCPVLDEYLGYRTRSPGGGLSFAVRGGYQLADRFATLTVDVTKPASLAGPAGPDDVQINNAAVPLTGYTIKLASRPVRQTLLRVRNALQGDDPLFVDTIKPERVLVPAAFGSAPPAAGSHFVDHYTCYRVRMSPGTPRFVRKQRMVEDPIAQATQLVEALKPRHLCLQADPNAAGLQNPGVHLMCYRVRASQTPLFPPPLAVADEFWSTQVETVKDEELCVPSLVGEDGGS